MKHYIFLSILAITFLIAPDIAHAEAGESLLTDVQNLLTGSLGTVVGLGISLFGLWVWLAQQSSWGILILIAGAAITAFPGLYKGLAEGFENAFESAVQKARPQGLVVELGDRINQKQILDDTKPRFSEALSF